MARAWGCHVSSQDEWAGAPEPHALGLHELDVRVAAGVGPEMANVTRFQVVQDS